jgi:hypothetical protein
MRLRQFTFVLGLVLLATFTLKAQNGQSGYWRADRGDAREALRQLWEGDTNNLTIIDVKTMKIIKKMTTGKHRTAWPPKISGTFSHRQRDRRYRHKAGHRQGRDY